MLTRLKKEESRGFSQVLMKEWKTLKLRCTKTNSQGMLKRNNQTLKNKKLWEYTLS